MSEGKGSLSSAVVMCEKNPHPTLYYLSNLQCKEFVNALMRSLADHPLIRKVWQLRADASRLTHCGVEEAKIKFLHRNNACLPFAACKAAQKKGYKVSLIISGLNHESWWIVFNGYRSRITIDNLFYSQAIPGETLSTPVIEIGWAFCTINCVLLTAGTFLMFTCINSSKAPRIITEMSKLSYGMYLMHIFWLGLWATVFKYTLALPTVAAIPCIAVSTFMFYFLT